MYFSILKNAFFKTPSDKDTCTIFPKFRDIITHCRNNYNWADDDTKTYDKKWVLIGKKSDQDSSLVTNSSEESTTTVRTTTTTAAPVIIPPSQRKKSKYKCQNAWCYQVDYHKKILKQKFIIQIWLSLQNETNSLIKGYHPN